MNEKNLKAAELFEQEMENEYLFIDDKEILEEELLIQKNINKKLIFALKVVAVGFILLSVILLTL